ncbi:MAG: DcaP family trimeric outer membrane transporter [Terracidiphilus sp.]
MKSTLCATRQTYGLTALLLLIVSALSIQPSRAQTPDAQAQETQQLKRTLEQLEQTMQDVRARLNALETKQALDSEVASLKAVAPPSTNVKTSTGVMPLITVSKPSSRQEPQEDAAKQTMEHEINPAPEGTFQMYGFAMLDSGYNFGQIDPNWYDVLRPTKLPGFSNEFGPSGNVFFSVRQTRWGVKTTVPTRLGDLKTIFEFELFGTGVDAGQTTFRLRHAWGELKQIGAGQTWSPFMDPDVFPNSIEYWGPTGMVFFRNIQARWTPWQKGDSNFMIAAERPGASADAGPYAGRIELAGVTPQFTLPDISAHGRWAGEAGHVQVAGIFRKISWVDLNATPTLNIHGTVYGWGINASGNAKFDKADTGRFSVVYGHGIQNYMNDAPIDVGVKNNFGNPTNPITGVPLPVLGIVAFDDHNWNERFSSTVGYSYENISNSAQELGSDFHQGHYALANLLYYPTKNVMMGGEFQFGRRVNFYDGWNYNDYRVQFSFKYNYGKTVAYSVK